MKLRLRNDLNWWAAVEDAEAANWLVGGIEKVFEGEFL